MAKVAGVTACTMDGGPLDGLRFECPTGSCPVVVAFYLEGPGPDPLGLVEAIYEAGCAQDPDVEVLDYIYQAEPDRGRLGLPCGA